MQRSVDIPAIAMQVTRGVVIASIQIDLTDEVLGRFRDDLLDKIRATDCHGAIFDLSGLVVLDSHEFASLRKIMAMSQLMGASTVLIGLRPGVVSALIGAGADVDDIQAAASLDAALAHLEARVAQPEDTAEDVPESVSEADDLRVASPSEGA